MDKIKLASILYDTKGLVKFQLLLFCLDHGNNLRKQIWSERKREEMERTRASHYQRRNGGRIGKNFHQVDVIFKVKTSRMLLSQYQPIKLLFILILDMKDCKKSFEIRIKVLKLNFIIWFSEICRTLWLRRISKDYSNHLVLWRKWICPSTKQRGKLKSNLIDKQGPRTSKAVTEFVCN